MGKQSEIVRESEGNNWHKRNRGKSRVDDPVLREIFSNDRIKPKNILEVACGNGWRLDELHTRYGPESCKGCDLSWDAIEEGRRRYRELGLRVGSADVLGYGPGSFDLVVLGFFLYLVDREDLFRIVSEVDRVLEDKGVLVIHDFMPEEPHTKDYAHDSRITTYKMPYHNLWLANPAYLLEQFVIFGKGEGREGVFTLRKDLTRGWPRRES